MGLTWEVHPRNADLARTHDVVTAWTDLELVERWPGNDTWTLTGPARTMGVFEPGMGSILTADGGLVTSGRMWSRRRWTDPDTGALIYRCAFVQDNIGGRIVYPDRTHAVTGAISTFPMAYDTRGRGPVEDIILQYVSANLGALALSDRRLTGLVLPTSEGRGGMAKVNARFDNLGVLVQDLAEAGRLRVTVVHDESTPGVPRLALRITEVPDVSADIRFGAAADSAAMGVITSYEDEMTTPRLTRAIVGGGGELTERAMLRVVDQAAEDLWRVVAEEFVDQRQTTELDTMTAAGVAALAAGAEPTRVSIEVKDGPDVQYRRDYGPGYVVGVDTPDGPISAPVREATTKVTTQDFGQPTQTVRVVVGTAGASAHDTTTDRLVDGALRRIEVLERST